MARLTSQLGQQHDRWRWRRPTGRGLRHSALDTVPVLAASLRRAVPHVADWSTVDVGPVYSAESHSISTRCPAIARS